MIIKKSKRKEKKNKKKRKKKKKKKKKKEDKEHKSKNAEWTCLKAMEVASLSSVCCSSFNSNSFHTWQTAPTEADAIVSQDKQEFFYYVNSTYIVRAFLG